jgi:hypothetical protein
MMSDAGLTGTALWTWCSEAHETRHRRGFVCDRQAMFDMELESRPCTPLPAHGTRTVPTLKQVGAADWMHGDGGHHDADDDDDDDGA